MDSFRWSYTILYKAVDVTAISAKRKDEKGRKAGRDKFAALRLLEG